MADRAGLQPPAAPVKQSHRARKRVGRPRPVQQTATRLAGGGARRRAGARRRRGRLRRTPQRNRRVRRPQGARRPLRARGAVSALNHPNILTSRTPSNEQTPQRLPLTSAEPLGFFWGTDWSPDGRRLAGWAPTPSTGPGVYTYDFGTNGYERLTDFGSVPRWLSDGRRLLLMTEFKLFSLGGEAGKPREIMSVAPNRLLSYALSRDDRTLFYDVAETEADIWLLTQD